MILFYTLVFTLTMPNHPFLATHLGPLTVLKCLGIFCLAAAIFEMLRSGKCRPLSGLPGSMWYFAYFAIAILSFFVHDGMQAFQADPFMFTVSTFSLFVVTTTMVTTPKRLRWSVLIALGSVAWGSLYVIRQWQHFHGIYPGFRTWGGLAGDPNYYAVTVVMWVPLIVFWLTSKRPRWEKWFCILCLLITLVGFIFAASRGGFLGLSGALIFLILNTRHKMRNFGLVALLMIPIMFAPGESAFSRLLHPSRGDEESSTFRLELWEAARNSFVQHPLFGVGMGHYRPVVIRNGIEIPLPFHVAHNTYMGLIADLGLAGIIPFLGILISSLVNLSRVVRRTKARGQFLLHQVALGLQAGLLGYAICAFFLSTLWQQVFWFSVFLSMCLPSLERMMARQKKSPAVSRTAAKPEWESTGEFVAMASPSMQRVRL